MEAGLSVLVLVATEAVEDQEDKLEAEATIWPVILRLAAAASAGGVDSSSSSSMSGSWGAGLGRDICLGGNGGGFRGNPLAVTVVVVMILAWLDAVGMIVGVTTVDSEAEATHEVGTSEGHLQDKID